VRPESRGRAHEAERRSDAARTDQGHGDRGEIGVHLLVEDDVAVGARDLQPLVQLLDAGRGAVGRLLQLVRAEASGELLQRVVHHQRATGSRELQRHRDADAVLVIGGSGLHIEDRDRLIVLERHHVPALTELLRQPLEHPLGVVDEQGVGQRAGDVHEPEADPVPPRELVPHQVAALLEHGGGPRHLTLVRADLNAQLGDRQSAQLDRLEGPQHVEDAEAPSERRI